MPPDHGKFDLPGLRAHWVGYPTDIDQDGCDGLYIEGYYFTDWYLFLHFCNHACRPFFTFSVN